MYCPKCGAKLGEKTKFCSACGHGAEKVTKPIGFNKKILLIIPLLLVLLITGYQIFRYIKRVTSLPKRQLLATYNKYPIWLLRDGKVAVYREMKVYTDTIEMQILVKNLSDSAENKVKVMEVIPDTLVSQIEMIDFKVKPTVLEGSQAEWEIDVAAKKQVDLSWKTKNLKYDVSKVLGVEAEETTFLKNFKRLWPTFDLKKGALSTWLEIHDFAKKEMQKSAREATTGKLISVSKDVTDILATMVTGTGILDTLNVMSELYSIGTTLYGDEGIETQEFVENANWLLLAGSIINSGWENKELVKASYRTGIEVLRAGKSLKAAATVNKLSDLANEIDPETGVTAAESVGLNIAGMIVDAAVINDVSKSSKYFLFEANEQAKMELASRYLVEWWQEYGDIFFTDGDAKKIMEMEILFFIAQQKELGIRKAYFTSQQGIVDTMQSWFPIVDQYSAVKNLQDTEDNIISGQNQLRRRYAAREDIYKLTQGKESGLKVLEEAEKKSIDVAKTIQAAKEVISEVVDYGSEAYEDIQKSFEKITGKTAKSITSPVTKSQPSQNPATATKTFNYSLNNFPTTLVGLPKIKTNTALDPEDQCNVKISPQAYMDVLYGNNTKIINARAFKLENENQALGVPKVMVDCISQMAGLTAKTEEQESILGYPMFLVTAEKEQRRLIDSSFVVIGQYMIGVTILVPEQTGGTESEHREIMEILIPAFLTTEETEAIPAVSPSPLAISEAKETTSGCQDVDLSNLEVYKIDSIAGVAKVCPEWKINSNQDSFQGSCQMNAVYRIYGVKEINTGGKSKLNIKANVTLEEPAHLFPGGGVHYDNYVDLIVFDQKPSDLATCNQTVDEAGWKTKCTTGNTSAGALAHCGVPKNSTSQVCDFEVNTNGKDKLYLVMSIHDTWSYAQVIGGFNNLQVCR